MGLVSFRWSPFAEVRVQLISQLKVIIQWKVMVFPGTQTSQAKGEGGGRRTGSARVLCSAKQRYHLKKMPYYSMEGDYR